MLKAAHCQAWGNRIRNVAPDVQGDGRQNSRGPMGQEQGLHARTLPEQREVAAGKPGGQSQKARHVRDAEGYRGVPVQELEKDTKAL